MSESMEASSEQSQELLFELTKLVEKLSTKFSCEKEKILHGVLSHTILSFYFSKARYLKNEGVPENLKKTALDCVSLACDLSYQKTLESMESLKKKGFEI